MVLHRSARRLRKATVVRFSGPNGAGKTTFAKEFLPSAHVVEFLNADMLAADPEIIIVADYGGAQKDQLLKLLRGHPLRQHLTAVREGHLIVFPAQAFSIPGPAALEAGNQLRAEVEKL